MGPRVRARRSRSIYTERPIGVSVANGDGSGRHLLQHPPDLLVASEAGMMGLALDPAFATNRRIYVCFGTHAAGGPTTCASRASP